VSIYSRYGKMNEKCQILQKQQDDALNRVRQAYKSQLADALAIVSKISQVSIKYDTFDTTRL
jgi:hypothetical protein